MVHGSMNVKFETNHGHCTRWINGYIPSYKLR